MLLGRRPIGLIGGAFVLGLLGTAHAQDGFALNRYSPSVAGSDWLVGESLDLRGHERFAAGLTFDWAHLPLVTTDADGNTASSLVENQVLLHLGGAVNLWDRVRVDLSLPLAVVNSGESTVVNGVLYPAPESGGVGDLRLGSDVRIVGEYGDLVTVAAGLQLHLPTGSQDSYLGDGSTQLGGRVLAAGDVSFFTYSAQLGINGRFGETEVDGSTVGTELLYSATAGVRFAEKKGLAGVEWFGDAGLVGGGSQTVNQEVLGTVGYRIGSFQVSGAAGPGITNGFGTPAARFLARLAWAPPLKEPEPEPEPVVPPSDRDGDGVVDGEDACPFDAGVPTDDEKTNGCPPPPPDADGDGIPDAEDACVDDAGVASDDEKTNGCPPPPPDPDRDGDGIPNEADACPDAAGPENESADKNGCPIVIVSKHRLEITERVEFVTGSAKIDEISHKLLDEVAKILTEHQSIELVEVEGHTDNTGPATVNRRLSQQRAESVRSYLIEKGIDENRLLAHGRGPDVPIADNATEEGRHENRRVEFHIRKRSEAEENTP